MPQFLGERVGLLRDDEGAAFDFERGRGGGEENWGRVLGNEGLCAVDGEPVKEEADFSGNLGREGGREGGKEGGREERRQGRI